MTPRELIEKVRERMINRLDEYSAALDESCCSTADLQAVVADACSCLIRDLDLSSLYAEVEGMVMVPLEPTEEMLAINATPLPCDSIGNEPTVRSYRRAIYRAMLTAAREVKT